MYEELGSLELYFDLLCLDLLDVVFLALGSRNIFSIVFKEFICLYLFQLLYKYKFCMCIKIMSVNVEVIWCCCTVLPGYIIFCGCWVLYWIWFLIS